MTPSKVEIHSPSDNTKPSPGSQIYLKVLLNKIANNSNLSGLKVHLILSNLTQIGCICKDKEDCLRLWYGIRNKIKKRKSDK